jgi:hypothetical protein
VCDTEDDDVTTAWNGYFVSSQTILREDSIQQHPTRGSEDENDDNNDDDDDDDDDDNEDGDSSMLSSAFLRSRTRSSAAYRYYHQNSSSMQHTSTNRASGVLLNLRGGANSFRSLMDSSLKSDISKKLFVTALVTLLFEAAIGHILEFLKIVMQTAPAGQTYAGTIRQITSEKGIGGLWDGFVPWGVIQAVWKGAIFGMAHAAAAGILLPIAKKGRMPMRLALTLAGGIGGGFQGYVLSPTLLLKTRVMTNPVFREKMSPFQTTMLSFCIGYQVVKSESLLTLMKGSNVFATKRVFDWASRFFFADMFETLFLLIRNNNGQPLSVADKSLSSFLGGIASTIVTLPLDVLVAKTQDAKKAGMKVSAWKLFQEEVKEKGLSGVKKTYMQGFEARLLHVCLTTVVVKTLTPIIYEAIFEKKQ